MRIASTLLGAGLIAGMSFTAAALAEDKAPSWTGGTAKLPAVALPAGGEAAASQPAEGIYGIYKGIDAGREIHLQIIPQGYHTVVVSFNAPAVGVIGNTAIEGNTVTFQDLVGCPADAVGTYTYEATPEGVTFTMTSDACAGRVGAINGKTLERVELADALEAGNTN